MRRDATLAFTAALILLFLFVSCGGRDEAEDESVAPELFEETFDIVPNPAEVSDTITLFFGFRDQDGDMEDARVTVRLIDDDNQVRGIDLDQDEIEIEGTTAGTVSFDIENIDETYQGTYAVFVTDEAGNYSNEIEEYLDVNPYSGDDDDDDDQE